jgi:hypothetical protein
MEQIKDRRAHARLLCAELIELIWCNHTGRERRCVANLEDISTSGISLHMDIPIAPGMSVTMLHGVTSLAGVVRHCRYADGGYFVGIQFDQQYEWSTRVFRPSHLLDPKTIEPRLRPN